MVVVLYHLASPDPYIAYIIRNLKPWSILSLYTPPKPIIPRLALQDAVSEGSSDAGGFDLGRLYGFYYLRYIYIVAYNNQHIYIYIYIYIYIRP